MLPFELYLLLSKFASKPIFSYVYDANGRMTYAGVAQKGASKASAAWLLVQFTLDGNGRATDVRISDENVVFNDYATVTYS